MTLYNLIYQILLRMYIKTSASLCSLLLEEWHQIIWGEIKMMTMINGNDIKMFDTNWINWTSVHHRQIFLHFNEHHITYGVFDFIKYVFFFFLSSYKRFLLLPFGHTNLNVCTTEWNLSFALAYRKCLRITCFVISKEIRAVGIVLEIGKWQEESNSCLSIQLR